MNYLCFGLFVILAVFSLGESRYVTFRLKSNRVLNLTIAMKQKSGLSKEQKQFLLDYHNELRARLAKGGVKGHEGKLMPQASNMMALEWDEKLTKYAHKQVEQCVRTHSKFGYPEEPYNKDDIVENLQGRIEKLETNMFFEVKYRDYEAASCHGVCGHYLNAFQWSVARVGCSYQYCPSSDEEYELISCQYQGRYAAMSSKMDWTNRDYRPGTPCTHCPKGYDYCMDGALCASKSMCDSSVRSTCTCSVNEGTCSQNGQFDSANCRCVCNAGFKGRNCDEKCTDMDSDYCFNIRRPEGCTLKNTRFFWVCPYTCNKCHSSYSTSAVYDIFTKEVPKDNDLTINAKTKPVVYSASDVFSLPNHGQCQNKEADDYCEYSRKAGYCEDVMEGSDTQCSCPLSCNKCSDACKSKSTSGFGAVTVKPQWGATKEISQSELDSLGIDFRKRR